MSASSTGLAQRHLAVVGLAREAGALALRYFHDRASRGTTMKGAPDFLTVADGAVETPAGKTDPARVHAVWTLFNHNDFVTLR